ncbi:MAG: hypothetical protein WBA57_22075 [Elainellaceae cyanobacterium]
MSVSQDEPVKKNEPENKTSSETSTQSSTIEGRKSRLKNTQPVNEALIAGAIAGVVRAAQRRGQTIEELQAEMLADHQMLDWEERRLLSEIVTEAWQRMAIASCN